MELSEPAQMSSKLPCDSNMRMREFNRFNEIVRDDSIRELFEGHSSKKIPSSSRIPPGAAIRVKSGIQWLRWKHKSIFSCTLGYRRHIYKQILFAPNILLSTYFTICRLIINPDNKISICVYFLEDIYKSYNFMLTLHCHNATLYFCTLFLLSSVILIFIFLHLLLSSYFYVSHSLQSSPCSSSDSSTGGQASHGSSNSLKLPSVNKFISSSFNKQLSKS